MLFLNFFISFIISFKDTNFFHNNSWVISIYQDICCNIELILIEMLDWLHFRAIFALSYPWKSHTGELHQCFVESQELNLEETALLEWSLATPGQSLANSGDDPLWSCCLLMQYLPGNTHFSGLCFCSLVILEPKRSQNGFLWRPSYKDRARVLWRKIFTIPFFGIKNFWL